tara:strand:- start:2420 stop:2662 length:243 start_codon:yes stop_codon:yes gene_type:complete
MNRRVKRISPRTYKRSKKSENEVIQVPNGKKMVENARSNLFMMVLGGIGGLILGLKMGKNPYLYTALGILAGKVVTKLKK